MVNAMTRKTSSKPRQIPEATLKQPAGKPVLLSGGNPQIAKADGDAPVQAYIAAMPGWKRAAGAGLDALITHTPFLTCAKRSNGIRRFMVWRTKAGFLAFTASPNTSR